MALAHRELRLQTVDPSFVIRHLSFAICHLPFERITHARPTHRQPGQSHRGLLGRHQARRPGLPDRHARGRAADPGDVQADHAARGPSDADHQPARHEPDLLRICQRRPVELRPAGAEAGDRDLRRAACDQQRDQHPRAGERRSGQTGAACPGAAYALADLHGSQRQRCAALERDPVPHRRARPGRRHGAGGVRGLRLRRVPVRPARPRRRLAGGRAQAADPGRLAGRQEAKFTWWAPTPT